MTCVPVPTRRILCSGASVLLALLVVGCRAQPVAEIQTPGGRLYALNCSTCHGPSGKGIGAVPTIVGKAAILGGDYARTIVAEGRNVMPSFAKKLTPSEINEIVDYIATFRK